MPFALLKLVSVAFLLAALIILAAMKRGLGLKVGTACQKK